MSDLDAVGFLNPYIAPSRAYNASKKATCKYGVESIDAQCLCPATANSLPYVKFAKPQGYKFIDLVPQDDVVPSINDRTLQNQRSPPDD